MSDASSSSSAPPGSSSSHMTKKTRNGFVFAATVIAIIVIIVIIVVSTGGDNHKNDPSPSSSGVDADAEPTSESLGLDANGGVVITLDFDSTAFVTASQTEALAEIRILLADQTLSEEELAMAREEQMTMYEIYITIKSEDWWTLTTTSRALVDDLDGAETAHELRVLEAWTAYLVSRNKRDAHEKVVDARRIRIDRVYGAHTDYLDTSDVDFSDEEQAAEMVVFSRIKARDNVLALLERIRMRVIDLENDDEDISSDSGTNNNNRNRIKAFKRNLVRKIQKQKTLLARLKNVHEQKLVWSVHTSSEQHSHDGTEILDTSASMN
jgi:hypothetical protein